MLTRPIPSGMAPSYEIRDILALVRHARMSTTYKPVLLKALTRIVSRERAPKIALQVIGNEFALLYLNQTVVFHLRQVAVISKEPEVLNEIRAVAGKTRELVDLPAAIRTQLADKMARILAIDVLERFHKSKPPSMPNLFEWSSGDDAIQVPESAVAFILANSENLFAIANYW